jgi:2-methylcitrate dehydratase PrpD
MSIAGVSAGGLMQYGQGGGSVKRIYTAVAARSGIQAATLAQHGVTGPEGILEGERGLLRIYSTAYQPERLIEGLGSRWTMETRYFKPYSCCGGIFAAIDALRSLTAAHKFSANEVASIQVGYKAGTATHAAITHPTDLLGLQFSTA